MPKVTVILPNRPALIAGGYSCSPCEARRLAAQVDDVTDGASNSDETDRRWSGVLVQEGSETGDGRLMNDRSLRWDTLPMPLRWDVEDDGAHAGAVVVGLIETLERRPNGDIWGTGFIDGGSALGRETIRKFDKGLLGGVSVDLDDMDLEIRVRSELLPTEDDAAAVMSSHDLLDESDEDGHLLAVDGGEGRLRVRGGVSGGRVAEHEAGEGAPAGVGAAAGTDPAGAGHGPSVPRSAVREPGAPGVGDAVGERPASERREAGADPLPGRAPVPGTPTGAEAAVPRLSADVEDGYTKVAEYSTGDELMVVLDARIRAATLVDIPAFAGARLTLDGAAVDAGVPEFPEDEEDLDAELAALVAAAIPDAPPAAWFANPHLDGPTAITITDDGRVYGHLALWDSCHIGYSRCVSPPKSKTNYALFLLGDTVTAEGTHVPTGRLTFDTRHANGRASVSETMAHYDHTGIGGADLNVGEDEYGIWVAGSLKTAVTPAQLRTLRTAPLSGDWRDRAGNLELVGILAVNIPGFPVPRPRALVASGAVQSLLLPAPTDLPERPEPSLGPSPALRRLALLKRARG